MYLNTKNEPIQPQAKGMLDSILVLDLTFGRLRNIKNKKNTKNAKNTLATYVAWYQYKISVLLLFVFLLLLCFLLYKYLCLSEAMYNTKT